MAYSRTAGIYRDGGVLTRGAAQFFGSPTGASLAAPVTSMAATPDGMGYWLAGADGGVLSYGDARDFGGAGSSHLRAPVVAIASSADGEGYWLVDADGGVHPFGDARYFGSPVPGSVPDPVVSFAPTPDGNGYWMVTSHGAVFSFGDAPYRGSLGATNLHNIPVVAIASTPDGRGYWLVQGGGEVTPYGDAVRVGSLGRGHPPVSGIAVTRDGRGYWLLCGNGEVDPMGDAPRLGGNAMARPLPAISAIVADPAAPGYWLLDGSGFHPSFTNPATGAGSRIVAIAASRLGPSPDGGHFCNPYGPCEQWCALFATWVWESAGLHVPRYSFVGDVYRWARSHTRVLAPTARPAPGDLVFYGTSPRDALTSPHIGIVAQVWPDGEIDTVEGDAGPGPGGWTSVMVNGPFLPSQSFFANGMPIYGYGVP
ncbi:MAG TPA: CHAP domain-containing protein [Acidimicrobiales bacterium]|nr:CHAP domain-containing protein [Acidimicrobiales bacterium]